MAVFGKPDVLSRDARQKGGEQAGLRVAALQFATVSPAYHEEFLAISAGNGGEQTERAGSQLSRRDRGLAKKRSLFW